MNKTSMKPKILFLAMSLLLSSCYRKAYFICVVNNTAIQNKNIEIINQNTSNAAISNDLESQNEVLKNKIQVFKDNNESLRIQNSSIRK